MYSFQSLNLSLKSKTTLWVGHLQAQSLSTRKDLNSVLRRDGVGDLSSVGLSVQQQKVQVLKVVDQESLVARWHHVSGLLVGTVTNLWLWDGTSETTSDTRVNTLLFSPVLGDTSVTVRMVTLELLGDLLNDLWVRDRSSHL